MSCTGLLECSGQQSEPVLPRAQEIVAEGFEGTGKELVRVLEHEVVPPCQGQVLLHSLANQPYLHVGVVAETPHNNVTVVATEVVEEDRDLVGLPQHEVTTGMGGSPVLARQVVVIPHLVSWLHWVPADVADACSSEGDPVRQSHDEALIVEQVLHAPLLELKELLHEPVYYIGTCVGLVLLVCEYRNVCHQLESDCTRDVVCIELRVLDALVVWRADALTVRIDDKGNTLLVTDVFVLEDGIWRWESIEGLLEVGATAEELVGLVGLHTLEVAEELPTDLLVHLALCYVCHESLETGDEGVVLIPVEEVDAAWVLLL